MIGIDLDRIHGDHRYRIRRMWSLHDQIKSGYLKCCRLWEQLEDGTISRAKKQELIRLTCWLKKDIELSKQLRGRGIEGVVSGDIMDIEKRLSLKINNNMSRTSGK
jgi:hypothetical protein